VNAIPHSAVAIDKVHCHNWQIIGAILHIEQRWCDVCCHSINGGDANLIGHQASKPHKSKVKESKKKKPMTITNFFAPSLKSQPSQTISPLAPNQDASSSHTTEMVIDVDALEEPPTLDVTSLERASEPGPSDSNLVQDTAPPAFLSRLCALTGNLPQWTVHPSR
jgi:hypothetical protein